MFLETQRDAEVHYHKRLAPQRPVRERSKPTIACRMAEWGNPGLLGGSFIEAKKSGLCKILEPQGSHLKKTSMLQEKGFQLR
jgi:hypothetical protein